MAEAGPAVEERRIDVNGVTLNVAVAGSGPTVLLLHGFPDSWHAWEHQVASLAAAGHRVVAPDLRGFGESSRPEAVEDYRMTLLVADALALLDELGGERADVVGHDWGAAVAWRLAMAAPQRVRRLVAVSVGHPLASLAAGIRQRQLSWYMLWFLFPGVAEHVLPDDDWRFFRQWAWGGAARGDDPALDRQLADLARPGALAAGLAWYRANIRPEGYVASPARLAGGLPAVDVPVMGVWSTEDMALGEEQMVRSGEHVGGPWRYERLDGVDHWVPVHAPERLSALLVDFLGDLPGVVRG